MKSHLLIPLLFFLLSCSGQPEKAPVNEITTPEPELPEKRIKVDYPKELAAVTEFPGHPYHKVIAYQLNGRYGHARAASVFKNRTGQKVVLTESQIEEFLSLFNNRKSYGYYEMACFNPRIGLVFYDASDDIVAYLSLCLECNNVRSEPALGFDLERPSNSGFTKKVYRQLLELFNDWGIPHQHNNPLME